MSRVGQRGQVVIPKELRDKTGLQPGVPVHFELRNDELVLQPKRELGGLRGLLADGPDMAARLLEDRAREPR